MPSYDELAGSPQEQMNESSGSTAVRKFLVDSANRLAFAQSLVGTGYPNFPQCRVNSISIAPWNEAIPPNESMILDPTIKTADYSGKPSLITVSYGPDFTKKIWPTNMPKPVIRNGTELRFRVDGTAQFLIIPSTGCKWEDNSQTLKNNENSRVLIPVREIELQWDFVDNPPLDALDQLIGGVNNGTFLGCEAETLLFEKYRVEESFRAAPLNPHTNRMVLNFRKRKVKVGSSIYGWNHDYRESPAGWAKVLYKSDDSPRYALVSLTNMFA